MHHKLAALAALLLTTQNAQAFCGFYVAKADASLYNHASQVAIVKDENRYIVSMLNDYDGDLKEFAIVVPVPVVLEKGQVHVGEKQLFDRLDAYSAPRLVEYHDPDPCSPRLVYESQLGAAATSARKSMADAEDKKDRARSLGVTIEASYTVGEYDIVILSAKQSNGLETWLTESGYKIPSGAHKALQPYINQKLKFFVAKVNLEEQRKTGLTYLRPLQFAYEYDKFMLPIRLGMLNANGDQDLIIYALTRKGRVETTNYRTIKLPTGMDIPPYIKRDFNSFYKAMFAEQVKKEDHRAVFTEYFWNMASCDPCSADPLNNEELKKLGVYWADNPYTATSGYTRKGWQWIPVQRIYSGTFLTRLHVRYSNASFPEDLAFQETADQENYQGRYVLRHPYEGDANRCEAGRNYVKQVKDRQDVEARALADLTGWRLADIRDKIGSRWSGSNNDNPSGNGVKGKDWWRNIWN